VPIESIMVSLCGLFCHFRQRLPRTCSRERESLLCCIYPENSDTRMKSADKMLLHLSEIF